jgi:hypothetical protein
MPGQTRPKLPGPARAFYEERTGVLRGLECHPESREGGFKIANDHAAPPTQPQPLNRYGNWFWCTTRRKWVCFDYSTSQFVEFSSDY